MMEGMWILTAILSLLTEGICTNSAKHLTFNVGEDATLTCSNLTWNDTMFVTWKINLTIQSQDCVIAFNTDGNNVDSCRDGKSLHNTSRGQSYLHIPNISINDVGIYRCESVFKGGNEFHTITLHIRAPPRLSGWWESEGDKMVAVCRAERGKPAANISWSQAGSIKERQQEHDGFFTVESRLELRHKADAKNLTCVVDHPYWREGHMVLPQLNKGRIPWITVVTVASGVLLLGGILYYVQKKLAVRYHRWSDSSQSKSASTEEVEEVEPYASYVQRVNSIYNSSVDVFT